MRSTFFEKGIEYQLEIDGENWNQGGFINGQLSIKNINDNTITVNSINLVLAYGLKKTIKEKKESTWEVLEKIILGKNLSVQSGQIKSFNWNINIETDFPITDKKGGLFLLFGSEEVFSRGGMLDLNIKLHPILQNFLQTFTTQFRFLEKYQKRKQDWTEVKLLPPESREFPNLESVTCLLRIKNENFEISYSFKMKTLGRSGQQMKITKKNREFFQTISKDNYLQIGGFPNRKYFKDKINEALNTARPEVIF